MGYIFFICAYALSAAATVRDLKPSGLPVNDYAGVLSAETERQCTDFATALERKTGFALVAILVTSLEGESIEEAANIIYERWGIGQSGKDEGALVLISTGDRKMRIETGYGAEGYITDLHASHIIRTIVTPSLKRRDYDGGVSAALYALGELVAQEKGISLEEVASNRYGSHQYPPQENRPPAVLTFFILLLFILFFLGTPFGRAMLPWLLLASLGSSRRHSGFGGGFGQGFGGGGGFGGFGGGMSGGGGASGSW